MTRPAVDDSGTNILQVNTSDLLSSAPKFYTAQTAISDAANNLSNAVTIAASSWDGDSQKQLKTLGDNFEKNLKALSDAMGEIAFRLHQGSQLTDGVEARNRKLFDLNS